MGGLCSKPEVASIDIDGSWDPKELYRSQIEDILKMSCSELDVTYIPKIRKKNFLVLAVGGNLEPKLFVRFYLIYTFYINKYLTQKQKTKDYEEIFYKLAAKTHPDSAEQAKQKQFKEQYARQKNQMKKEQIVLKYVFNAKFIIENINQILLGSDDPKDICHLIFPLTRIYNGIKKNYNNIRNKKHNPIYMVVVLEEEQKELIKQLTEKNGCFAFSIFMKGFTVEKHARAQFNKVQKQYKNQKPVLFFTVEFPNKWEKMDPKLDYGFYINPDANAKEEGDVLFNVMNTFKIARVYQKVEYDLQYGYLPALYHTDRVERIKVPELASILRVYDICNAVSSHYLKSQSCLYRIIKQKNESLKLSKSIISNPRTEVTSSKEKESLAEIQTENVINNCIDEQQYEQAMKNANKFPSSILMKAKKVEILFKQGSYAAAKELIQKIGKIEKEKGKITQAGQIIEYISARLLLHDGEKVKAASKLRALSEDMMIKYNGEFQVIGTDVITALEEALGGVSNMKREQELFKSQAQNKTTIKQSAINLRGISTTI